MFSWRTAPSCYNKRNKHGDIKSVNRFPSCQRKYTTPSSLTNWNIIIIIKVKTTMGVSSSSPSPEIKISPELSWPIDRGQLVESQQTANVPRSPGAETSAEPKKANIQIHKKSQICFPTFFFLSSCFQFGTADSISATSIETTSKNQAINRFNADTQTHWKYLQISRKTANVFDEMRS